MATVMSAQNISIGMRDNQYVNVQYIFKSGLLSELENSVFTTKFKHQHICAHIGYRQYLKYLEGDIRAYYGTAYNNSYDDYGMMVSLKKDFSRKMGIELVLNPHKDSDYGYTSCYKVSIHQYIFKEIAIELISSNIPEHREALNRIKAGLILNSRNLCVRPQVSIPTEGHIKNVRVLVSFNYQFK
jgi:hypothetical protein